MGIQIAGLQLEESSFVHKMFAQTWRQWKKKLSVLTANYQE